MSMSILCEAVVLLITYCHRDSSGGNSTLRIENVELVDKEADESIFSAHVEESGCFICTTREDITIEGVQSVTISESEDFDVYPVFVFEVTIKYRAQVPASA
jgi:hypothetical protein